ncbi:MAG TPA: HEAT repeat domain-containing protein [Thermoanaerobaculia bacterium]|nr:HEAT repeat domain-containing protein [Thermoanaerobaculia bacterium]
MRPLALLALVLSLACTTAPPPPPAAVAPPVPEQDYGITVEEEARLLQIEDARQYDATFVAWWVQHPNVLHRVRIAQALGRIGPHAGAGIAELTTLAADRDRRVREMAAFAFGEIADPAGMEPLFTLANDADLAVAAEAAEALSKLGGNAAFLTNGLTRYLGLTEESKPEGLRARATRYLFRIDRDEARDAALRALASPSSAVRQEGAYALGRLPAGGYPKAARQLELLLSDRNVLTRAYATRALGQIADAASTEVVLLALNEPHPWVRTNAAVALNAIFTKNPDRVSSAHLPRIFAVAEDSDPGVRAMTIPLLGHYSKDPSAAQRLQQFATNGTQAEREIATGVIARFLGEPYLATHPYEQSPWGLVRVLENIGASRTFRDRLIAHETPLVRFTTLSTIPDDRVNEHLDLIRRGLTDTDVIVRTEAINKYATATGEDRATWIANLEAAEQRERGQFLNDARLAAIAALANVDRPERAAFLRGLLDDTDPVVRRVAADFVASKLGEPRPKYTPLPVAKTPAEYEEIVRWSRTPHTATIHMTRGRIELALLAHEAPMTAWNFAQLARKKYFDNTSFMRVVPNFVIQGGDPRNDQNGGPGYAIRDEINLQKYTRGAVGMALSGPDTGGSQFFIAHSPQPHLDGGYTIFARVYDGMSGVVDQTERGDRVTTITIDERPPVSAADMSISNVSLPLVVGAMTPDKLLATVPTYEERKTTYTPDLTVIEMMKSYVRAGDRVEVYMGTWCNDSEREVPKFLRIADDLKSQFGVDLPYTFVAVDRSKHEPAQLLAGKNVSKVATFIYYRGDEELGRIEEKPSGVFEDDLLAIVARQ